MADAVRVYDLTGSPWERGLQHGAVLRDRVRACVELYSMVLGRSEAEIAGAVPPYASAIRAAAPEIATEIEGIAEGAGVAPHWIYALNARSELVRTDVPECTAVCAPAAGLLGQTWDWLRHLADLFVVLRIERPDGHRILTLTEPGMVAKVGLSSSGLGVTLNFLPVPAPAPAGVPIHVLLRMLLDAPDLATAETIARGVGPGASGNVIVGSVGAAFGAEYDGTDVVVAPVGDHSFAHTNHHLAFPHDAGASAANSQARLDRARELGCPTDLGALQRLLSDQADPVHPICAPYVPTHGVDIGTLCTVAMDLAGRRMFLRPGPDPSAPWHPLDL